MSTALPQTNIRRSKARKEKNAEYDAKRKELVRIAAQLFRKKGYAATRFLDVAREAGIDRASLYYYVSSKEELLRESIEGIIDARVVHAEQISRQGDLGAIQKLRAVMSSLMTAYVDNFPHMYVYIQEIMLHVQDEKTSWADEILGLRTQYEHWIITIIEDGKKSGELRSDIDSYLIFNGMIGMFNSTHRWFTPDGPIPGDRVADAFFSILIDGLRRREV